MKNIPRRDKLIIYGDLLAALQSKSGSEKIVLSQVQTTINLPYDRMKTYIKDLVDLGLVENQTSLKLTSKGKQYIKEYKRVLDFIKRMGISYG
jgi:predicted transcriptional regulator